MMIFGSLFSGIGAMDLGFERAGMTCKWQVEIDDYATKILNKRWPDVPKFRDVRECGSHNLATVDLIAGGFPCQDVSNAGTTHDNGLRGLAGERSGLWFEFDRIICELQPRWVVIENTAALANRGLPTVLRSLAESGYDADWQSIPAYCVGALHKRERLFIVAQRRIRYASELPECECCGEPYCPECELHYHECDHPGPSNWFEVLQDADSQRLQGHERSLLAQPHNWRQNADSARSNRRHAAPRICRKSDGVAHRVDRLKCLGNAVYVPVITWIGRKIMEVELSTNRMADP